MKIIIEDTYNRGRTYFISQKDNDDFDNILSNLFSKDLRACTFFDKDDEPNEAFKPVFDSVQPDTWNPEVFIEWFNKNQDFDFVARLDF